MVKIVKEEATLYDLSSLDGIMTHIERCGRTCYKSENMITSETAVPFIKGILKSGHESVIEHANVIFSMPFNEMNKAILTMKDIRGLNISCEQNLIVVSGNMRALRDLARVYDIHDFLYSIGNPIFYIKDNAQTHFTGIKIEGVQQSRFSAKHNYFTTHSICDLGAYKDITRHRLASFSIESTRYCNYAKGKFGSELTMIEPSNIEKGSELYTEWLECIKNIEKSYMKMADLGAKGDQVRMVLPHSTKADMIMSANAEEWNHIFNLRCHQAAHPSVQVIMKKILTLLYNKNPDFFENAYNTFIK